MFYMTLGIGQPYYPGYFEVDTENENQARAVTAKALNRRWCGTYEKLEDVHPWNKICRGEITLGGELILK